MSTIELGLATSHGLTARTPSRSPQRTVGLWQTLGHGLWGLGTRAYLHLWHGLHIHGRENLPLEPPFILVANHTSHLDALALAAALPLTLRDRVFPLAAADVFFESNVLATLAAGFVNAIPLARKRSAPQALHALRRRLVGDPCAYIMFPEGCRSRDGTLLKFRSGVGMLVANTSVPIVPCHLSGCYEALPPGARWPRRSRITLRIGAPLRFAETANERADWQRIAGRVESAVHELSRAA